MKLMIRTVLIFIFYLKYSGYNFIKCIFTLGTVIAPAIIPSKYIRTTDRPREAEGRGRDKIAHIFQM